MEMQMEHSFEKNVSISSYRMFASDSVSLPRLDTSGVCPNLERHGLSRMQASGGLEMPHFLNRISICIFI